MDLLIKQARIEDGEELKDVGITAGKIVEIAPSKPMDEC